MIQNLIVAGLAAGLGHFYAKAKKGSSAPEKRSELDEEYQKILNELRGFISRHEIKIDQELTSRISAIPAYLDRAFKAQSAALPTVILNTLQGSANTVSGKLGEIVGLLSVKNKYDRILMINDVVDAIAIRFTEEGAAELTFLDFKSNGARLTKEQRTLRDSIINKTATLSFEKIEIKTSVAE